jgi:hypothetical protein
MSINPVPLAPDLDIFYVFWGRQNFDLFSASSGCNQSKTPKILKSLESVRGIIKPGENGELH